MSKASKQFAKLMAEAQTKADAMYIAEVQRLLLKYKSLSHYVDAMGATFFVHSNGEILEFAQLPLEVQEFMSKFASDYYDYFKSYGVKVYPHSIVTDW